MPSPMTISIRIQPYLVDFLVKVYGPQPIAFPRKDNFNKILNLFLDRDPATYSNYHRSDANLEIQLPYFENKNVLSNFSLSPCQQSVLAKKIEDMFKLTFRDEIDQCLLAGVKKIQAIHLFMEKYEIREESIDMLLKDYHRFRHIRHQNNFRKREKNLSVKSRFCPAGKPC